MTNNFVHLVSKCLLFYLWRGNIVGGGVIGKISRQCDEGCEQKSNGIMGERVSGLGKVRTIPSFRRSSCYYHCMPAPDNTEWLHVYYREQRPVEHSRKRNKEPIEKHAAVWGLRSLFPTGPLASDRLKWRLNDNVSPWQTITCMFTCPTRDSACCICGVLNNAAAKREISLFVFSLMVLYLQWR